jgi:flagellar assembly protein FliH
MSDPLRSGAVARGPDDTSCGASWSPPHIAGPLITFRGKQTAASSLQDDIHSAREAGFERGRSEGFAAAAAEVAQRIADLDSRRQLLDGIARHIAAPLERCDEETAEEMARLALTVGAQLARRELTLDPRQVIAIIRECLPSLPSSTREVRIHMHPRDAAVLRRELDGSGEAAAWTLVEDPMVSHGGCRIEAEASRIDARLGSRVAAAVAAVLGDERGELGGSEALPPLSATSPPEEAPRRPAKPNAPPRARGG